MGLAQDTVEAVEGQDREPLELDGAEFTLVDVELSDEREVVLAVGVGGLLGGVERHRGEFGEGRGIGQFQLLPGWEAHDAVELDGVLG